MTNGLMQIPGDSDGQTEIVNPLEIQIPLEMEILALESMDMPDSLAHANVIITSVSGRSGTIGIRGREILPTLTKQLEAMRDRLKKLQEKGEKPEYTRKDTDGSIEYTITFSLDGKEGVTKRYQNGYGLDMMTSLTKEGKLTFTQANPGIMILGGDDTLDDDKSIEALIAEMREGELKKLSE